MNAALSLRLAPSQPAASFGLVNLLIRCSEYVTGDRFSPEFVERRRQECVKQRSSHALTLGSLKRFLIRIARHPTLARSTLLQAFFESTEWVRCRLLSVSAELAWYAAESCVRHLCGAVRCVVQRFSPAVVAT